jgi:hypothetical protein
MGPHVCRYAPATAATFTTAKMITCTTPLWLGLSWLRTMGGVNIISLMGTISAGLYKSSAVFTRTVA